MTESAKGAASTDTEAMVCLLTGLPAKPLPTHPKITGLSGVGGLAMGDVMVGFDKAAFGSYGLDQSANAAMSARGRPKICGWTERSDPQSHPQTRQHAGGPLVQTQPATRG